MKEKIVNKPSIKYDANGNMIYHKDSDGFECWKEYDENNNLIHHKDYPCQESQAEIIQPRIKPGMEMRYLMPCPLAILTELEVGNRDGNPVDNS